MKTTVLILMGVLTCGATAWAYGPYCDPAPRYASPVIVYRAPVVVAAPVYYAPQPRVVYVQPAPVVYQAPVIYSAPVCVPAPIVYAQPAPCLFPLFPFWFGGHHGGGHHR